MLRGTLKSPQWREERRRWRDGVLRFYARLLRMVPIGRRTLFLLGWQCAGAPTKIVGTFDDSPIVVDVRDKITSLQPFLFGVYEPAISAVLLSLIQPGMCVFDVGANKGLFSLMVARRVGSMGRVVSYEPLEDNLQDMCGTRQLCGIGEGQWSIEDCGISDRVGTAAFSAVGEAGGHKGWGRIAASGQTTIGTTTIDSEVRRLQMTSIDMVKMDIEGHEHAAIAGMSESLSKGRIKRLLLEVHPRGMTQCEMAVMFARLLDAGMSAWRVREDTVGPDLARRIMRGEKHSVEEFLEPLKAHYTPTNRVHLLWRRTDKGTPYS